MRKQIIILVCITGFVQAQRFADQLPQIKRYTQQEVFDSVKGIVVFDPLIEALGGDSVKYNRGGYNMQGWAEEYYENGKTLHKGYYIDGKLKVFKNYYENGNVERTFSSPDPLHCTLNIYYDDGSQMKKVLYYDGKPQKVYEYYRNGSPKYSLENEKEMNYIVFRKSWYDNGQVEEEFELADKKNMYFKEKRFYKNGQLMSEGNFILNPDSAGYVKEGMWTYYDEMGKNKRTEQFKE